MIRTIDGHHNHAQSRLEHALDNLTELEAHWQIGSICLEGFRLFKLVGDLEVAKSYLKNVESVFEKAGAVTNLNRVLDDLKNL
ncbi:MAG TPA: hypothetical protein VLA72_11015 [Anaerolineales bacterium]|nr:hypothetical protein [Anaerolineales bacterium]